MEDTKTNNKFKCKAYITYEFTIEAENAIFEAISDSIGEGIIPLDIYDSTDCFPIPMLESVDVAPFETDK